MNLKITAKLRNVSFWAGRSVVGTIFHDKKLRFADGTKIYTSDVEKILIVTRNSVYEADLDCIKNLDSIRTREQNTP